MADDSILAIDNGTQSVRALLFDPLGNLLARQQVYIEPYYSTKPGLAEQDPDVFWNALCDACQGLFSQDNVDKESITAVSLTTQRSTVLNLDETGKPLRPAIVWLDQRRTEGLPRVGGLWGLAFRLIRASETVAYLQAEAEANWIRTHEPHIWEKTFKYLFLSGYLTYRLTGDFVDSVGCQVGYVPFDYKRQNWAKRWDWKWKAVPMEAGKLPRLVEPSEILGTITESASKATGIPERLPVYAAASDKACEVIGSGCFDPHIGCLSYGTTATINTTHRKYHEVIPLIPPYPSAVPGSYSVEIQIYRGYWMVSWFKREFGLNERRKAEKMGIEPESLFDDLIEDVPPGSELLILQPYWSPGLKNPGPEARGAIIGFGDVHTRAHIYRAILEGLTFALREGSERIAARTGVPVTQLRVAGGGSQSDAAVQITSDIFGLPTSRPHVYDASGLGAAIDAAVGSGLHSDFKIAVKQMTRIKDTFLPDKTSHEIYDEMYRKIYKQMYLRLKPLYSEMTEIIKKHRSV